MLTRVSFLLFMFLLWALPLGVQAGDAMTPAKTAEVFYQAYAKSKDSTAFVQKSRLVHPKLKKAFAKYMNGQPEFDPIIDGQDFPAKGWKVVSETFDTGDTATVVLKSRDEYPTTLTVHFILEGDDRWLISGVNDFPFKP